MIVNGEICEKVKEITCTDYNEIKLEKGNVYLLTNSVESMLEDLIYEVNRLKEQIDDIIRDRNDNWKPISQEEQL